MEDGDLVVYADGRCHLTSEEPSSATALFEVPDGRTFTLSLDGETYDFDGNESVTITRHPLPGEYNLTINYDDDSTDSVKLEINDRLFIPTFKVDEIRIDRSNVQNFARQMESNGNIGRYITNSNLINYELPYINIPTGCKTDVTPEYLYRNIHIKLNDMSERGPYGYEYNGNAVKVSKLEDSNGQWCFVDCTWKKDQTDTIYMMFNGRVYDSRTISTYDSNPNKVCLRGITDSGYNHRFNVNQTYTARDLFGFYPGDTTSFTLNMKSFSISDYDTSALRFTTVGGNPTNWVDFYDNYLRLNVLKSGTHSFYVNWKTTDGIGGKYMITVTGVTDGSGKKQSSSSINN